MTTFHQNLVCTFVIGITISVVAWLGQVPLREPHGLISLNTPSSVSTAKLYPIQEVAVYDQLPFSGKVKGELTAELAVAPEEDKRDQIQKLVDYARAKAGAIGANGFVVEMVAERGQVLFLAGKLVEL